MRALVHKVYGGPELLEVEEVAEPVPAAGQVRVRVHAASINAADYRIMRADPWLVRLANGLFRPKRWPIMGGDFAGVVDTVGPGVTTVRPGDAVFGDGSDRRGAHAERVVTEAWRVAPIPAGVSFTDAAAVPLAGITAMQAVRRGAELRGGERVLVAGAGGGVGGYIVQIARAFGARVTAVCGPGSVDRARAGGAEVVLDYTRDDFAARDHRYDVIFAVNGERPLATYRRCLAPGGRLVVVGGTTRQIFAGLLLGRLVFLFGGRTFRSLTLDDAAIPGDLATLAELLRDGRLRAQVDRVFPLTRFVEAFRHVERGGGSGKVVLAVNAVGSVS